MNPFVASFADELVKVGAAKSVLTSKSSNVKGWSYNAKTQELDVTFRSGGTYRYAEVPRAVARAMRRNKSAGKTIHKWVKAPGFSYEKLSSDGERGYGAPVTIGAILGGGLGATGGATLGGAHELYGMSRRINLPESKADIFGWFNRTKIPKEKEILARLIRGVKRGVMTGGGLGLLGGALLGGQIAKAQRRSDDAHDRIGQEKSANDPVKETVDIHGIPVALEWRRGETRKYYNHDPLKARSKGTVDYDMKMKADYGYVKGVIDADGEELDVYLGPNRESEKVFVLEKLRRTDNSFDENKIMLGYSSVSEARQSYLQHQGKDELGSIAEMTVPRFKAKFMSAAAKKKFTKHGAALSILEGMSRKRRQIAKLAGVAKKQVTWNGLTMKLEYLKGDRRFVGMPHERTMKDHYGYMPGTYGKGADGEAIDVYFSPEPLDGPVYKVKQKKKTGEYDEDKFMVGYTSSLDARKAFLRNMPGWAFGSMTGMTLRSFRNLVGQG
ncbi:MAG: KTSC domain-containing protein [Deltaproteobacteria bacterium]|nr:KTSC domain-containing protein [Deltaproteobacteria bacterium]